jgi:PIN domain nuclease of toxin-antitoxin system/antitoxin (DNA-binding transcriptional repressor) of toxin-antitoxin stability system
MLAKVELLRLVAREAHGEEIVVAKAGKPVARLVAVPMQAKSEPLGEWGQNLLGITFIADDFYDELPPEMFVNSQNDDLLFSKKTYETGRRFLSDSPVLLWLGTGDKLLCSRALATLRQAEQRFLIAASRWESALNHAAGKLPMKAPVSPIVEAFGLLELPVSFQHGKYRALLQLVHRDPSDRLLLAQSQLERLNLVTAVRRLTQYGVPVLSV